MAKKPVATTDAASEFAKLAKALLAHEPNDQQRAHIVFNTMLKLNTISNPVHLAYAALNKRADALCDIIGALEDDWIDEEVRAAGLSAVRSMQEMFAPSGFLESWNAALNKYLRKEHLLALVFLSPIVSRHHPLPAIKHEQITSLLQAIEGAESEIDESVDLPDWAKQPLLEGMRELHFRLDHFFIFGHEESFSRLLVLLGSTIAIAKELDKAGSPKNGLFKLFAAIILATDLFTSVPNISQAYVTYSGWVNELIENARPLLSPPLKQLEGPQSTTET